VIFAVGFNAIWNRQAVIRLREVNYFKINHLKKGKLKMITYIKLGKTRGLSFELNNNFGLKPFFRKNSLQDETIIDIPWAQIIFTSGRWVPKNKGIRKPVVTKPLPLRRASNVNKQDHKTTKRARRVN
jgi:hypothetical protein